MSFGILVLIIMPVTFVVIGAVACSLQLRANTAIIKRVRRLEEIRAAEPPPMHGKMASHPTKITYFTGPYRRGSQGGIPLPPSPDTEEPTQ